ncbi:MAG: dihydrodipicolinate synthase family protein [Clostridiales bacterium]|jgi:dihydrodipicolinate synthase/N-acetylneuraminate lyase|nr:dihydrodipicolinate synthase family protein [Clostridiales bacterium]
MTRHETALSILHNGTVIPATPLALTENREFDESRQRLLTRYYLEAGAGGIATAVHSTQFEIRDPKFNMFEKVIASVSDEISRYEKETGKTVVKVCGVCGKAEQAVREANIAKSLGYDAVLLSPGGLKDLTEDELLERTKAVAAVMPVIGFYLQVAVGGRVFTYDYWRRFCEIENTVAIKCASFNRYTTIDVVRAVATSPRRDEITLYTGNDDNIIADLLTPYSFTVDGKTYTKRFTGGLLGHWTVWTKKIVELFPLLQNCDATPELMKIAAEMTDMNAAVFDTANNFAGCIAGMHEVLRRQGLLRGIWCLNPAECLSEGQEAELDRVQRMYPHLTDDDFVREFLARHEKI